MANDQVILNDPCWINQQQLTEKTGFSRHKIRHLVARGKLPAGTLSDGRRFWQNDDINRALIQYALDRICVCLIRLQRHAIKPGS